MTTEQLLAPLQPDERALVPLFYEHFDEGMLRELAEADYGYMADECLTISCRRPRIAPALGRTRRRNLIEVKR